jgi:hypothetical protein
MPPYVELTQDKRSASRRSEYIADRVPLPSRTPATKTRMAQRIVRSAHEGVTDVQQLVVAAVAEGMEPAL